MLARRKMQLQELAEKVDITMANLSILKTGCKALNCQPANILEFVE
jgi:putative transcriptional regulator